MNNTLILLDGIFLQEQTDAHGTSIPLRPKQHTAPRHGTPITAKEGMNTLFDTSPTTIKQTTPDIQHSNTRFENQSVLQNPRSIPQQSNDRD